MNAIVSLFDVLEQFYLYGWAAIAFSLSLTHTHKHTHTHTHTHKQKGPLHRPYLISYTTFLLFGQLPIVLQVMDFSSVPRALQSLSRRVPAAQSYVEQLQQLQLQQTKEEEEEEDATASAVWIDVLSQLVTDHALQDKWEPLAVALYAATQLLLPHHGKEPAVYLEGPRVPTMTTTTTTTTAPTTTAVAASSSLCDVQPQPQLLPDLTATQRETLIRWLHGQAMQHLQHGEPRIRTLVAKAVAVYLLPTTSTSTSTSTTTEHDDADDDDDDDYTHNLSRDLQSVLIASIRQHIVQGRDTAAAIAAGHSKDSTGALDDTTGWRALETNWQTLAALVTARKCRFLDQDFTVNDNDATHDATTVWNQLLQDAEYSAVTHVNRHVRAAVLQWLEQCVTAIGTNQACYTKWCHYLIDPQEALHKCLAAVLKAGLADNWSQVRMAASVLTRVLFVTVQSHTTTTPATAATTATVQDHPLATLFPTLLPRMCLNRFYLAQGVKLYSHETWRTVMQDQGLARVVAYLPAVCRYYTQAADADNHVVREAACQAMAELGVRLASSSSREYASRLVPHVPTMLQSLIMCFYDESWPVRDEACLATALLCKAFPDACEPELATLWQRWSEQLNDQIWSVRQDAAVALGDALEAFPTQLWPKVHELLIKLLPQAKEQPAMTREDWRAHQNDMKAHTDTQLYSCGSLAPKLSKKAGAGRIGCSNCGVDRDKAPWEASDGCLYLLRELVIRCNVVEEKDGASPEPPLACLKLTDADFFIPMMHQVVDVCRVKHFPQADELRATLWRQLPVMADAWGKDKFKKLYLHIFTELLMDHLDMRTASALSKHAAGQCADALANLVGRGIFRGRLEDFQQDIFDQAMRERASLPAGPSDEFSPYGPPGLLDGVGGGTTMPTAGRAF